MNLKDTENVQKRALRNKTNDFAFEVAHDNDLANVMKKFHWHNFMEITYINSGSGTYYIEDKVFSVKAGDFIVINNVERHREDFNEKDPLYETVFHFDSHILDNAFNSKYSMFDYESATFDNKLSLTDDYKEIMIEIVNNILNEDRNRNLGYELGIISQLIRFVSIVYRCGGTKVQPQVVRKKAVNNINRLENILKYISSNIEKTITEKNVAEKFYLNQCYFSDYFKRMMGVTFSEYVRELRINKATKMIIKGDDTIANIALSCGFSSLSSFYSAFTKHYGMSPQKYVKQITKNDR